jgi:cyclase
VVAIDAKEVVEWGSNGVMEKKHTPPPHHLTTPSPQFQIFSHGGRNATGIDAVQWAQKMAELGAGEILLTSMDRDGTKIGVNLELTRAVSQAVSIPVIASGGIGELSHFAEAVREGKADAVLAASVFHYGTFTISQVKQALKSAGVEVRI